MSIAFSLVVWIPIGKVFKIVEGIIVLFLVIVIVVGISLRIVFDLN